MRTIPEFHSGTGKYVFMALLIGVFLFKSLPTLADAPIYQGMLWDAAPAAAYNPQHQEYLVVWNVFDPFFPPNDVRFFGPVMGQFVNESGQRIREAFVIFDDGVQADVAFNEARNEYLVVAERWFNTDVQRVSALGNTIGGPTTLLTNARYPQVLYNPISEQYLVTGAWLTDSSPAPNQCNIKIRNVQVEGTGQPVGSVHTPVDQNYFLSQCPEEPVYAIAYAPVTSTTYPQGKYLLAVKDGRDLNILGSDGTYSVAASRFNNRSQIDDPFNIDVAFGYLNGDPVFFLVWGETNSPFDDYDGLPWNGIWSGFIDAVGHSKVANNVFPISRIWEHWADDPNAKKWRPVTAYNGIADEFIVTWRETPTNHPNNMTNQNHIRANTRDSLTTSSGINVVVSSTSGSENPVLPCIVSSTTTKNTLIVWEDSRNFLGDIYGSPFGTPDPIPPTPPGRTASLPWLLLLLSDGP